MFFGLLFRQLVKLLYLNNTFLIEVMTNEGVQDFTILPFCFSGQKIYMIIYKIR